MERALSTASRLTARHIQDFGDATQLEPHWGYADRVLPCTVDAGSCAYLDLVYGAHDRGMYYVGVFWLVVLGILMIWAVVRQSTQGSNTRQLQSTRVAEKTGEEPAAAALSGTPRFLASASASARHYLLPDTVLRPIFGRTTRLQVLILAVLAGYLLIFTFVGMTYQKWITPVKKYPGVYNTRTTLGPFADRLGVLAYALIPLSIVLSGRESVLTLITGVPYQHFLFLHRWVGYIILIQSLVHTIGWTIVEAKLYQPQPSVAMGWISETYMIWGCVAIILLVLLFAFTLPFVIRRTGYEFFRKAHYVLAMIFLGACWGHWEQLKCFILPGFILWGIDRFARLVRTFFLHYNVPATSSAVGAPAAKFGFTATRSSAQLFDDPEDGDIVRLDFEHLSKPWSVGQHWFLTFLEGSVWQSHPFTPLNLPYVQPNGLVRHSYLFRAKGGETKKIALALKKRQLEAAAVAPKLSTDVILTGPYGSNILTSCADSTKNVLLVAGGTGITFVLPVLLHLCATSAAWPKARSVELVWIVRRQQDLAWCAPELACVQRCAAATGIRMRFFVTREVPAGAHQLTKLDEAGAGSEESSLAGVGVGAGAAARPTSDSEAASQKEGSSTDGVGALSQLVVAGRPHVEDIVRHFVDETTRGSTVVYASGPGLMTSQLRSTVAKLNDGGKVWKGEERYAVELVCDDRAEW